MRLDCFTEGPGLAGLATGRLVGGLAAMLITLGAVGPAVADSHALAAEQSAAACAARDLPALFNAMAISDVVRQQYLAEKVTVADADGVRPVLRDDYARLPIGQLDFSYVTSASLSAWEADPAAPLTYVQVEFNQSQDDRWRVDWSELSGPLLEGGDADMQPEPVGRSGYLLFFPTATCWELVEDHIDAAS